MSFAEQMLFTLLVGLCVLHPLLAQQNIRDLKPFVDEKFNFIIATDLGRNGHYEQKPIADLMGRTAEEIDIEFVISSGDTHHYEGVQSVQDPLWMTNYELIYSHPELLVDWYPILGNHEYRGNTQAVIKVPEPPPAPPEWNSLPPNVPCITSCLRTV